MTSLEKRDLFFKFLYENGLYVPNKSIVEIAPSVIQSQSTLLVDKYGRSYPQYLLSPRYEYANPYGVKGDKGGALLYRNRTIFEVDRPKFTVPNSSIANPQEEDFDTLLIQVSDDQSLADAYSLAYTRLAALFGDVVEAGDKRKQLEILELYRLMCKKYSKCELIQEPVGEDKIVHLIMKR